MEADNSFVAFRFKRLLLLLVIAVPFLMYSGRNNSFANPRDKKELAVKKTSDFDVTNKWNSARWEIAGWVELPLKNSSGNSYNTKVKVLYSDTGIYFLFYCEDHKITAAIDEDYQDLFNEDVVEVFLWTDEKSPVYFEYEISPLNFELPLLVPNYNGSFKGWLPWHYEGERKVRHTASITGGDKKGGASCSSWSACFFIPFKLLQPLQNVPPKPGTKWRANMYRIDYDDKMSLYSWADFEDTFHDFQHFGTFKFK